MKKLTLIAVLFLILGLAFTFGADVDKISVSGTVGMSFGDSALDDGLGPVFSATKAGTFATISVGSANDKVQAGVTVSLVPAIDVAYNGNTATGSEVPLEFIYKMITYYTNALQGTTYMDDDGVEQTFPIIDFNALEDDVQATTGLDFVIFGNPADGWTVIDVDVEGDFGSFAAESDMRQDHIDQLSTMIYNEIYGVINTISVVYVSATGASSYSGLSGVSPYWTTEEQAAAWKEAFIRNDFRSYTGESIDDVLDQNKYSASASTPVTGAFLKLNAVGGVLDITFEVNGKAVAIGSMVTSHYTSGAANLGLSLDLAGSVVPGLSAGIMVTNSSDTQEYSDDSLTYTDDTYVLADEANYGVVKNVYGMQLNVGYTYASDAMSAGAMVKFGIKDLGDIAGSGLLIGIEPMFAMPSVAGLNVGLEFDIVTVGNDDLLGIGLGANVGASIMGISPSVYFKMKTAPYGGDDSYDWFGGDNTDDASASSLFASIDDTAATALGVGVSVDLADLIGMKLVTVNANWDMVANDGVTYMGFGAGLGLNFADVLSQPLTLGFNISKFSNNVMGWEASVGYTYAEIFMVTGAFGYSGADEALYYSVGGSVSF